MAIGLALDRNDLGMMNQTVDERDHASGIGKHLRPFTERLIRGYQRALLLVAAADELEEQIRMAIRIGQVPDRSATTPELLRLTSRCPFCAAVWLLFVCSLA